MANGTSKEELNEEINELLFGQDDVVDFSKMTKMDLGILKNQLDSDQALFIAARLADNRGVGRGKLVKMAVGEQNLEDLMNEEGDGSTLEALVENFRGGDTGEDSSE